MFQFCGILLLHALWFPEQEIQAECIYHDQIDDQMLRRPDGRPDGSWVTRCLLGDQIAPGDSNGDQICRRPEWSCAFSAN